LSNGRLAMLGIAGIFAQEFIDHRTVLGFKKKLYTLYIT
jgi:hypothetical protein